MVVTDQIMLASSKKSTAGASTAPHGPVTTSPFLTASQTSFANLILPNVPMLPFRVATEEGPGEPLAPNTRPRVARLPPVSIATAACQFNAEPAGPVLQR